MRQNWKAFGEDTKYHEYENSGWPLAAAGPPLRIARHITETPCQWQAVPYRSGGVVPGHSFYFGGVIMEILIFILGIFFGFFVPFLLSDLVCVNEDKNSGIKTCHYKKENYFLLLMEKRQFEIPEDRDQP